MAVLQTIGTYATVFATGGTLCAIAELLIVRTKLTPARILVIFLIAGIILEGIGVYDTIFKVCQAGISVPIVGFGASLAKGSIDMARSVGFDWSSDVCSSDLAGLCARHTASAWLWL